MEEENFSTRPVFQFECRWLNRCVIERATNHKGITGSIGGFPRDKAVGVHQFCRGAQGGCERIKG